MSVAERAAMYAHLDGLGTPGRPRPVGLPSRSAATNPTAPPEFSDLFPQGALWPRKVDAKTTVPTEGLAAAGAPSPNVAPVAPAPTPALATPSPAATAVRDRLTALRFAVLMKPPVPGIDMAAERAEGYPQRVIVFTPDLLDDACATSVLAKARELDADMALVVCAQADADAKRRFIATKARHVDPADLAGLEL